MPGELAAKVRAKYPGAYDSVDDATLEKAIVAKYPQYASLAEPEPADRPMTREFGYPIKYDDPNYEPPSLGEMAATGVGTLLTGAAMGAAARLPWGRILSAAKPALKTTAIESARRIPIVGPAARAGIKAGRDAWKANAPAPAVSHAPTVTAGPKPKLSAKEVAEMLRREHGSEKAGRMLFGPARPGLRASERQAAIKRLAPGESALPASAKRAIDKEIAASTADEAFAYAAKAPNKPAQDYFGEQLRRALLEQMKKR